MNLPPFDCICHVLWDWNGTLLDDAWLCIDVMNELLAGRKLPELTAERYQSLFGFPVRRYYQSLGFDFAAEPFERVGTEFIEAYHRRDHQCVLRDGARTALEWLAVMGMPCTVLSASQQTRMTAQATRLGVSSLFQRLLGLSDHYAGGKLELGRQWLADVDTDPSSILLVGDTDHDAEVARELGLHCVLIPSGHQSENRLDACGVPVLPTLDALVVAWQRAEVRGVVGGARA
jgi:phosphoglycolate phosphatase